MPVRSDASALEAALLEVVQGPIFRINRDGLVTGAWAGTSSHLHEEVIAEVDALCERLPVAVHDLLEAPVSHQVMDTVCEALDAGELRELTYHQFIGDRDRTLRARCTPCGTDEVLWLPEDRTPHNEARDARAVQQAYQDAASQKLQVEQLLAACSQRLLTATSDDLDEQVMQCLADTASHFGADVAYILGFNARHVLEMVAQWRGPNAPPELVRSSRVRRGEFNYGETVLSNDPLLFVRDASELLGRGRSEEDLMSALQDKSFAWVRIGPADDQKGIIGLSWKSTRYEGSVEPVRDVVRLGEAILSALNRRSAERLLAMQRRVLELVAKGASLWNSLGEVARMREGARPSLRSAVLLVDERSGQQAHLSVGAAPSFPTDAVALVSGLGVADVPLSPVGGPGPQAWSVAELPPGTLAERLVGLGAVTVVFTPITSGTTGRMEGLLLTIDKDLDPEPLVERALDEMCGALAKVAIEQAAAAASLARQATHDPLTGVASRAALLDRLEGALLRARQQQAMVAVLFCDLDRFKEINDAFGHAAGDDVLREVARRLTSVVHVTDTVSRFGGDEFVVVIEGVRDEEHALDIADRVAEVVSATPMQIGGTPVHLTVSIGVAISVAGIDHPESLVRDADVAMYRAKSGGRARLEVFRADLRLAARDRDELARDLAAALAEGGLEVHYQPLLSLTDGRVTALEALTRWRHPVHGLVSPEVFIPIAEETGLIVALGRWVTDEAIRQLAVLEALQPAWAGIRMHVNLSARQLAEQGFIDDLRSSLARWEVPAKQVALEITETVLMVDSPVTAAAIGDVVDLGADIVLDDFGTGYASLTYLRRFPVSGLKIDRSFVSGLGQRAEDDAVVRAVVDLARSLDLDLVAEGVETAEQADFLRGVNCQAAQGYFFARPTTSADLPDVLAALAPQ